MSDTDVIAQLRLGRLVVLNTEPADRQALEQQHGQVWDGMELRRDFKVVGFMAPLVVARRRSDDKTGSLEFQHHPRFYFNWRDDQ